jgi:hypothetical protein
VPAEQLALRGELTDERDQVLVVRIPTGLQAQHRGSVHGDPVEVDEEFSGRQVEVDEAGDVRRPLVGGAGNG